MTGAEGPKGPPGPPGYIFMIRSIVVRSLTRSRFCDCRSICASFHRCSATAGDREGVVNHTSSFLNGPAHFGAKPILRCFSNQNPTRSTSCVPIKRKLSAAALCLQLSRNRPQQGPVKLPPATLPPGDLHSPWRILKLLRGPRPRGVVGEAGCGERPGPQ